MKRKLKRMLSLGFLLIACTLLLTRSVSLRYLRSVLGDVAFDEIIIVQPSENDTYLGKPHCVDRTSQERLSGLGPLAFDYEGPGYKQYTIRWYYEDGRLYLFDGFTQKQVVGDMSVAGKSQQLGYIGSVYIGAVSTERIVSVLITFINPVDDYRYEENTRFRFTVCPIPEHEVLTSAASP